MVVQLSNFLDSVLLTFLGNLAMVMNIVVAQLLIQWFSRCQHFNGNDCDPLNIFNFNALLYKTKNYDPGQRILAAMLSSQRSKWLVGFNL